ncbi:MAG TPA: EamA family transporter [Steroidobacteraceae bacterium]|nr:EamA family transporter [Steroidobacteraceae bacterium]
MQTWQMQPWVIWSLAAATFAALTAVLAKLAVDELNPDIATFIRTAVVLVVLGGILGARGQYGELRGISRSVYVFLTLSGLATGASWVCYFRALHLADAARVAPLDKLSVVLVAIFGVSFLGEKLSLTNWAGVGMIAAGAWLVAVRA